MPEKDGSEDKKSTKSVVNKKQKQFMNQEEQLDLSSVAESFGGQIVGEPVELDEFAISVPLGAAALAKYGIPLAMTALGAYGTSRQMQGKPLIPTIPNLGIKDKSKKVFSKIKNVLKSKSSTQDTSGQIEDPWNEDDYVKGDRIPDSSSTAQSGGKSKGSTYNRRVNPDIDKSFGDALKKNRKKLNPPEIKGDPLKTGDGSSTNTNTNTNTSSSPKNNKNNKKYKINIGNIIKGKTRAGAVTRSSLTAGSVMTGLTNLTKGRGKGFRMGGLPGTAHNVGRRTNPQ